jgi:hypothetical protein
MSLGDWLGIEINYPLIISGQGKLEYLGWRMNRTFLISWFDNFPSFPSLHPVAQFQHQNFKKQHDCGLMETLESIAKGRWKQHCTGVLNDKR